MNYNQQFEDTMDNINNIAKGYGFKNGINWATVAQKTNQLNYGQYKKYENAHNLRVRFSHGNARDISVSQETYNIVKQFERDISRSHLRNRSEHRTSQVHLPRGTFRSIPPFRKDVILDGQSGRTYRFSFEIVEEYQRRAYDDGTRFEGRGFSIYIISAPHKSWCANNSDFHFYNTPVEHPSICWNALIKDFREANAVMLVWAKRYVKILDRLMDNRSVDFSRINQVNHRHSLPSGTFRSSGHKRHLKTFHMPKSVYEQIMNLLGKEKPELGGMLGWKDDERYIDYFVFDKDAKVGNAEYNPNTEFLTSVINGEWEEAGIYLGGFVHSHPGNSNRLSDADIEYAVRIMKEFDLEFLFMPLVNSSYGYISAFYPYYVRKNGRVYKAKLVVDDDKAEEVIDDDILAQMDEIEAQFEKMGNIKPCEEDNSTFARVSSVLDIPFLKECSIIGVGCGGSKGFYENMARVGVGNFYLMDGDKISQTNIASQHGFISEIGQFKTECTKKRILDIDNSVDVTTFNMMLDDSLDDSFIEENIISKVDKSKTILCAFTDNFFAQARLSRIAIKYQIPFLCAQHHERGEVSEIVYWYPGVSKHTLREIAKSRYDAYKNGYSNTVTSCGSPIFNTTRLNSLCEKIATGMLLFSQYPGHIYSRFLQQKDDCNLILIRQNILPVNHPFYDLFESQTASLFDDAIWVNPELIEDIKDDDGEEEIIIDTRAIF